MEKFIQKCIHERKIAIEKGIESYSQEEIEKIYAEFKYMLNLKTFFQNGNQNGCILIPIIMAYMMMREDF